MKRKYFFINCIALPVLFLNNVSAAKTYPFQVNLFGGVTHANVSAEQLFFQSTELDTLHDRTIGNQASGGLGFAYRTIFKNHPATLGLDWTYLKTHNHGDVFENRDTSLPNYDYELDLNTNRFMINAEMQFCEVWQKFSPFAQLGVGIALINVDYHDTPKPDVSNIRSGINLGHRKNNTGVVSFGLGIKRPITPNIEAYFTYQISDLGTARTHKMSEILTRSLDVNLRTHDLFIGIHYLIG